MKTLSFRKISKICLFASLIAANMAFAEDCPVNAESAELIIDPDAVIRHQVPKSLFGFDLPWYEFQLGYYRQGKVRDNIIQWMTPFKGTIYRYHGGNSFEWNKSVGKVETRKKIYAAYSGDMQPEFGPQEFLEFLDKVDAQGIMMLNLSGPQNAILPQADMVKDNIAMMQYVYSYYSDTAKSSPRISYWELGNELDWKPFNWSADHYIARAKPLVLAAKKAFPQAKFIANGRTDPWQVGQKSAAEFNGAVAKALATDGVSIHPYYDGGAIPEMIKSIDQYAQTYKKENSDALVMITEHGRWPPMPKQGRWEDQWYLASGSLGAISASDFVLSIIPNKNVGLAAWHAMSVRGPWQLFRLNKKTDDVYPSVTYWGLRTLREGLLDHAVSVTPEYMTGNGYNGGYDRHFIAMKSDAGDVSLLAVNRSDKPVNLKIKFKNSQNWKMTESYITRADAKGEDNSDEKPNKYSMEKVVLQNAPSAQQQFCLPSVSMASIKGLR